MVGIWVDDPYETKDCQLSSGIKTHRHDMNDEILAGWWWDPFNGWLKNLIQELGSYIIP